MRCFILFLLLSVSSVALYAQIEPQINEMNVHEAFLQRTTDLEPIPIINAEPPKPIEETPPNKPTPDTNWIPGYWKWIPETQSYAWVCGVWRKAPPGQVWVPGVWTKAEDGWAWLKGFWSPTEEKKISYIQAPPPYPAEEEITDPPGDDFFWAPGYWEFSKSANNYAWYQGTWIAFNPNWIYVPSSYVWRPDGFIFNPAYWDYPLDLRGVPYMCKKTEEGLGPFSPIESTEILNSYFVYYPDYIYLYWHSWHYHNAWWGKCWCLPPWWQWQGWWATGWRDQWALWWWYGHPGYPQPAWLTQENAKKINPPNKQLGGLLKASRTPLFVTPKGISSYKDWRDALNKNSKDPKKALFLPSNKKEMNELRKQVEGKIKEQPRIYPPTGEGTYPNVQQPKFRNAVESAGSVRAPELPKQKTGSRAAPSRLDSYEQRVLPYERNPIHEIKSEDHVPDSMNRNPNFTPAHDVYKNPGDLYEPQQQRFVPYPRINNRTSPYPQPTYSKPTLNNYHAPTGPSIPHATPSNVPHTSTQYTHTAPNQP